MSYSIVIKNVPNTPAAMAAVDRLRGRGIHTRLRGRGHRYGGGRGAGWRYRPYDQDLPRHLAERFSVYQEQPGQPGGYRTHCDYVGIESSGKLRVRLQA